MAQLYSIVTPNLTGTKLSLDSLYELALRNSAGLLLQAVATFVVALHLLTRPFFSSEYTKSN